MIHPTLEKIASGEYLRGLHAWDYTLKLSATGLEKLITLLPSETQGVVHFDATLNLEAYFSIDVCISTDVPDSEWQLYDSTIGIIQARGPIEVDK